MNYHIMIDDKFFDGVISDIESLSEPNNNRYFVRRWGGKSNYVTHPKTEWVEDINDDKFLKFLYGAKDNDKIFVYWYDLAIGKIILKVPEFIPVYVAVMGGDFTDDPILINRKWLFDKETLSYFNQRFLYPVKWARRPNRLFRQIKSILEKINLARKDFKTKKNTVNRIDYLMLQENMDEEFNWIIKKFGCGKVKRLAFMYNQNFDAAKKYLSFENRSDFLKIQIGNSATYSNNHLDLLNALKHLNSEKVEYILPLSYGDSIYSSLIKEKYKETFGERVSFLVDFMPRKEYVRMLNEIDICIMYHNRSQALGNCVTLLTLGKKLYIKKKNPLWGMFKGMGVKVYDADDLNHISFAELSEPLSFDQVQNNIDRLGKHFSERKRLECLRKVLGN